MLVVMQRIPLTQGKFALVDNADFEWLNQWKWYYIKNGYAVRSDYSMGHPGKQVKMHRQLMKEPQGMEIDHKNTDRLDNRRSNLRVVTKNQNQQNANTPKNSRSGFKGVSWCTAIGKWRAILQIQINGKTKAIYLGCYNDPIIGAKAYNQAATKYFGEFARLNNV